MTTAQFTKSAHLEVLNLFGIPHGMLTLNGMDDMPQPVVHMQHGQALIATAIRRGYFDEERGRTLEDEMREAGLLASLSEIHAKVQESKLPPSALALSFEMCLPCMGILPPHGYIVDAMGTRRSHPIGTFADGFDTCVGNVQAKVMSVDLGTQLLKQMSASPISLEETGIEAAQPRMVIRAMVVQVSARGLEAAMLEMDL